jgi:acyl-CoA hydrolase
VPDGATIQLGASALAEAIAVELHARRGLTVRSGLVGDWLVGLYEAGAMAGGVSTHASLALGSPSLYEFLDEEDRVEMCPMTELLAPEALTAGGPFFAMNSAIEVDLLGQVNAEVVGGRYVGAVGGAVDFFRAAQATDGLAVLCLAAGEGERSRIVPSLSGPVATSKSDVDVVVTEWGTADLRAAGYAERVSALTDIADPGVRAALRSAAPSWVPLGDESSSGTVSYAAGGEV